MKAWDDIKDQGVYRTENSSWWLDHGVKIERMDLSGRVIVKNALTTGDWFDPVRGVELVVFEQEGWKAGVANMNVNYWSGKVDRLQDSECEERLVLARGKLARYKKMLVEARKK